MNDTIKMLLGGFIIGFLVALILTVTISDEIYYKQGQIDALNGKIFYEKTTNKDNEIIWEIKKR